MLLWAPIPSDRPGLASRLKGVRKNGKKWRATINIASEGGSVRLGTFDSEEEAGIMHARARYKYPVAQSAPMPSSTLASRHRSTDLGSTPAVYDIQGQAGELDEIDGIMIEAFADDGTAGPPAPSLQPRSRPLNKSRKSRKRPQPQSQLQTRPFRHQLLFSGTCVIEGGDAANSREQRA